MLREGYMVWVSGFVMIYREDLCRARQHQYACLRGCSLELLDFEWFRSGIVTSRDAGARQLKAGTGQ